MKVLDAVWSSHGIMALYTGTVGDCVNYFTVGTAKNFWLGSLLGSIASFDVIFENLVTTLILGKFLNSNQLVLFLFWQEP